jgi:hypothetical protein
MLICDNGLIPWLCLSWLGIRMFPKTGIILNARWNVTRMSWKTGTVVTLVKQELLTLPKHLSSTPVFSGVCVTRSLALSVCVINHCLSFCPFSFGHCVVCSSSTYGFWLPLWYLQTLLNMIWTSVLKKLVYWTCEQ